MCNQFQTVIVIPCYNEAKNFNYSDYANFISNNLNILICFVNDGSSDNTLIELGKLKENFSNNVDIVSYDKNQGKGEAVRTGVLYSLEKHQFEYLAYLDADLAVSLEECISMTKHFKNDIVFCFGSRIARIGSEIQRKKSRFLIGRAIATIISNILSLKVYDTQCGCKLFTRELAEEVFSESFITTWLFDVEIFSRIIEKYGEDTLDVMLEVPLKRWIDKGNSKVKYTYFFRLFVDLYRINRRYKDIPKLLKNK
jgi:glycosyltransferase involved in cell wall biosynthesis